MTNRITRLLIVEDDPLVLDLHKRLISTMEGFEVVGTSANGSIALDFLQHNKVDCVLLDIFVPGIDGLELLKKIRDIGADTDAIIISAAQEGDKIKEALRLGAYGYILKPFKYERLRATLCSLRNHQRNIRQQEVLNTQELIDKSFDTVTNSVNAGKSFPKGIQEGTLQLIECAIKDENAPISAGDLAKKLEISRVTVQRYINFLKESGRIMEEIDYRQKGRPVKRFTYIS